MCDPRLRRECGLNGSHRGDLQVYRTPELLAQALAGLFADEAAGAIAERGAFSVALAGGTTPRAAYALLAQDPYRSTIGWKDVFVYFGDERCVPPTDEQSNYRMASRAFLDAVAIPPKNVHRMRGEDEPARAAQAYARVLREDLGDPPRLDLVLLGMGADGHTASLFPGSDPFAEDAALVRAPFVAQLGTYRLTLTPRAINGARHVAIATEGAQKAAALAAVLEGPYAPMERPVQAICPRDGRLTWLVDSQAAALLTRG